MRTKLALNPITGELDLVTRIDTIQVEVDFGFPNGLEGDVARATVAVPWVTAKTMFTCTLVINGTADHPDEEVAVENITAYVGNIIPNVSFDVIASAPHNTWGKYLINVVGV